MNFTAESCRELIGGFKHNFPLLGNIEKICNCLDNNATDYKKKCPCSDISTNNETVQAFEAFNKCFEKNTNSTDSMFNTKNNILSNLLPTELSSDVKESLGNPLPEQLFNSLPFKFPNALEFLTNECYTKALRGIINSSNTTTVCGVSVSEHKTKIETVIKVLETIQTSAHYTLKSVRAVDSGFTLAEKLFKRIINDIKDIHITIPMCISLSVTVILILMFYKIYTGGPLFGRRKKKKKKRLDYDLDEETQFMPMPMAMPTPMPMLMPMAMPMAMPMPNDLSLGYQPLK